MPDSVNYLFIQLNTDSLPTWLDDPATLVLDIRPHAAYSIARLPRALSLSVPSTLLKRPLFSLQRLSEMLPSPTARLRFSAWRTAPRILVYDADASSIPDSSNIHGLLRKFKSDGYSGDLAWLQGGFQAVWCHSKHLVDTQPPTPEIDDDDDDDHDRPTSLNVLRTRHLPMAAFSLSSTTLHNSPHFNPSAAAATAPINHKDHPNTLSHPAFNPFFDTIRQNIELSHGITERITLRLPRRVRRRINDLPFLWLQQIARRAAPFTSNNRPRTDSSSEDESEDDDAPDPADVEEGTEALAMQFYRIELAEKHRLHGIMEHHSKESGAHPLHNHYTSFPFSITAGVEKGAKNRYRHIWPFEHARVRLHQKHEEDDDYVNASYVQPLGTSRRYIATQGPLPATFVDFWTLCWEQNVHVIVMLTREVEGSMIKCGSYWTDSTFGPLRLHLVSTSGHVPPDETQPMSGFFAPRLSVHSPRLSRHENTTPHRPHNTKPETIKRVFDLTHTGYPDAKPRRIVHLQYLDWPDMNVPEDPRGLLGLIKEVDAAVRDTMVKDEPTIPKNLREAGNMSEVDERMGVAKHALGANSPVLLHCSAGVGRTGGFIAVDSVLHAVRREIRKMNQAQAMDVDKSEASSDGAQKTTPVNETQMQVDAEGPDTSESEHEKSILDPTAKWVENLRTQDSPHSMSKVERAERSSIVPFPSGSSGSEESLLGLESFGSYNPSSSLGTTVSGASSPIKAFFPPSSGNTLDTAASLSIPAPPPKRLGQTMPVEQMSLKLPPRRPYASLPSAMQRSSSLAAPWLPPDRQVKSPLPSTRPTEPSPLRLSMRDPMLVPIASDNEPPSRSVSPSIDQPSPPHTSLPLPHASTSQAIPHTSNSMPPMSNLPRLSPKPDSRPLFVKSFDYKEPRALHEDFSPLAISSFEEPICEVIQDMREQRMSLCQSLRQYVFVHAAVIEGALMVVDEENGAADERQGIIRFGSGNMHTQFSATSTPMPRRGAGGSVKESTGASSRMYLSDASSTASVGKRGASPTELLNVDREGLLAKRPSVKRKHRSGDDVSRGAPFQRVQAKMTPPSSSPPR